METTATIDNVKKIDAPVRAENTEMYIGYTQECKEDRHWECSGGGYVVRTAMDIKFCCADMSRDTGHVSFRDDHDEVGARGSLRGLNGHPSNFCTHCGAPIVLELLELK